MLHLYETTRISAEIFFICVFFGRSSNSSGLGSCKNLRGEERPRPWKSPGKQEVMTWEAEGARLWQTPPSLEAESCHRCWVAFQYTSIGSYKRILYVTATNALIYVAIMDQFNAVMWHCILPLSCELFTPLRGRVRPHQGHKVS